MMMIKSLVLLALLGLGFSAVQEDTKNRPVTKVVNLLKDMGKQLEKEAEEDEDVYDKVMCWCKTNDEDKTNAIAAGEQKITDLGASIESLTAASARLTAEIATLNGEVAKNTGALDKATSIRRNDLADFNEEEKDTIVSITGLKNAILVLGKHNSFLQSSVGADDLVQVALSLKATLRKHVDSLAPSQRRALTAFVQAPEDYLGLSQQPASAGSYASQSGAIFGILKNMKESFESGLSDSQGEEARSVATYEALKAAKEDEIASGAEQASMKSAQLAEADEKAAVDKQALVDTTNTLKTDRDFLAMLKSHCSNTDAQMEERQKTRTLEIAAVSKATAILTSDEAHESFTKTFNPAAFLQTSQSDSRRERAAKALSEAAKKLGSPRIALLATKTKLAGFTKVVDAIQKNIDDIAVAKEDEIKLKDYCIEEFANNAHETALNDKDKNFQVSKVADLTSTIEQLEADIEGLNGEVAEMQLEMKKAAEDRAAENSEFQQTVNNQRATQQLLTSALNVLKGFYGFVQTGKQGKQPLGGPAPPPGFKTYENNSGSGGVMGMISGIIADAKALEEEATRGENSAQSAYEDFVADTNAAINAANTEITNKNEAKGKAEGDRAETQVALDNTMATLQNLSNENADAHAQCDFTLANFDVRQQQKDQEMEALKGSIQILRGAAAGR